MLLAIGDVVGYCISLLPNIIFFKTFKFYGSILNKLFQRIEHQVIEAVLPMIEGSQSEDRFGIFRKSLLSYTKTCNKAGVQESEDYQNVECKFDLFSKSYFFKLIINVISSVVSIHLSLQVLIVLGVRTTPLLVMFLLIFIVIIFITRIRIISITVSVVV